MTPRVPSLWFCLSYRPWQYHLWKRFQPDHQNVLSSCFDHLRSWDPANSQELLFGIPHMRPLNRGTQACVRQLTYTRRNGTRARTETSPYLISTFPALPASSCTCFPSVLSSWLSLSPLYVPKTSQTQSLSANYNSRFF